MRARRTQGTRLTSEDAVRAFGRGAGRDAELGRDFELQKCFIELPRLRGVMLFWAPRVADVGEEVQNHAHLFLSNIGKEHGEAHTYHWVSGDLPAMK
jgi:hypothetical protein